MGEDNLGSPVREGTRTPTHAKRKASRKVRPVVDPVADDCHRVKISLISTIHKWNDKMYHQERLTSESLQSLYDVENGEKPEADRQIHR